MQFVEIPNHLQKYSSLLGVKGFQMITSCILIAYLSSIKDGRMVIIMQRL